MSVKTVITDVGFDLLRAAPGYKLVYTRAACGSGHAENTQLATLTDVVDFVMNLSIVEVKPTETAATLRLQLDNSKAPREFQLYQIGVFAKLLDGNTEIMGETLLQVMQYEQPDIVRAIPHLSEFVVNTLMGQAENVEGIIDLAAYVSIQQFGSTLDDLRAQIENKVNIGRDQVFSLEYNTDLFESAGHTPQYWRNAFNEVGFTIILQVKAGKSVAAGTVIATIPEGFRPAQYTPFVATYTASGTRATATIDVLSNGNILYQSYNAISEGQRLLTTGVFVAK